MKKTQRKDALRNIGKQKVSYLSILIIALMGVTAFLGICYAAAAMKLNGSKAYNELDFRGIEVISAHLLTGEDLDALKTRMVFWTWNPCGRPAPTSMWAGNEKARSSSP